ncbi:MAG: peptide-methionine (S)-S-oxide reductase MsrA, partial [Gammaproteobacteria bacterium]
MKLHQLSILILISLFFIGLGNAQPSASTGSPDHYEKATFAGGCFWCVESDFDKVPGVIETVSGYTGGHKLNPTYEEVSAGGTGHTESVQITYDPQRVSYEQLLKVFWHSIDPTTPNAQFCDHGNQYRTAIFSHDDKQRQVAEQSKQALE